MNNGTIVAYSLGVMTVSQHAPHHDPETETEAEAAKWSSAILNFIIYCSVFHTVMCQNVIPARICRGLAVQEH